MLFQEIYGRSWTKIAELIPTRTTLQIKSFANQYLKNRVGSHVCHICGLRYKVNGLKFQTLVVFQKGLEKQQSPRSDYSLIRVFPVCYSDKHFENFSPDIQHFISENRKRKVFDILEHLPYCLLEVPHASIKYPYCQYELLHMQSIKVDKGSFQN